MSHSEWSQHVHFYYRTIRYHTEVMLGLEDAFARRGGRGQLDSIKVPELVEAARHTHYRYYGAPDCFLCLGSRAGRGGEAAAAAHRL